jgi:hypothetical protein
MPLRSIVSPGLLALCQLAIPALAAESADNPTPCHVTADASIEARITTNSTFGEVWEYHGQSGGAVTLRVNYLLTPMGELSGLFNLDPGEISYAICVADAAGFFSLPSHIETNGDAVMVDGPELTIIIKRGGTAKTVQVYDPSHLRNRDEVARFLRVWDRIFKPLPVRPEWHRASDNRSRGP